MKKLLSVLRSRIWLLLFLAGYFLFAFLTYKNYGISFDELDEYLRGKLFYTKIRGNDPTLQRDFVIWKEGVTTGANDLLQYNHVYAAGLYMINGSESMEKYHLLNLLFAAIVFIATYEAVLHATKKPLLGLASVLTLFLTPRFLGDIPSNPKDIPFAISYFVSLFLIYRSEKWDSKLKLVVLGLSFGLTQSLRIIGYSIYPIYFIYALVQNFSQLKKNWLKGVLNIIGEMLIMFLIGFLVHILTHPYLGADPFNHFIHLLQVSSKYPWLGTVLLFGHSFKGINLPWFYLPAWFLVSMPIFFLVLFVASLVLYPKLRKNSLYILMLSSLIFNLAVFFILRPTIYDGIRHMLFLIPMINVLNILALNNLLDWKKLRIYLVGFLVINCILVARQYVLLHPYEYVYFNELVGGLPGAHGKFETDYWGLSNREATIWIRDNIAAKSSKKVSVDVCGNGFSSTYFFSDKMYFANNRRKADYVICWERFQGNKDIVGSPVYSVTREGVPLVHVIKVKK